MTINVLMTINVRWRSTIILYIYIKLAMNVKKVFLNLFYLRMVLGKEFYQNLLNFYWEYAYMRINNFRQPEVIILFFTLCEYESNKAGIPFLVYEWQIYSVVHMPSKLISKSLFNSSLWFTSSFWMRSRFSQLAKTFSQNNIIILVCLFEKYFNNTKTFRP